ncbi:MAG: T9SS type A sorting domain-containing protein [Candidatus Latescibacteria bacterium]|nr:T9SS type A sorting domain-containing protein [Candidatus Latescibacterota bacterium]
MVNENVTVSTSHLGRLAFDVAGLQPLEITEQNFVLTIGDVLLEVAGEEPVIAQIGGSATRTFDPAVARVYHDRLEQNFPNPFNPTTTLAYSLKNASNVNVIIYDVAGRRVRELVNERRERGAYKVVWDGRNDTGTTVSSGVYFYKLVAGSFTDTKKMTILK